MKIKELKTIRICDDCGTPLIWTFAFDYAERYCLNCGLTGGMLGTGKDVPATIELTFKKRMVDSIWNIIYSRKGLVPVGATKSNCKKCDTEKHIFHLTDSEKEWNRIARVYIEKVKGIFNESNDQ